MLSSALSALIVLSAASTNGQRAMEKDMAAWQRLQPSVAFVLRGNEMLGSAALVDSKGLFLTHLAAVYSTKVKAKLSDGRVVEMTVRAADEPTQLAVLQASDWDRNAKPLVPADGELKPGDRLLAIRPNGMIRAQFVSGDRFGVVSPSNRLMPLSEVSFESASEHVDGALVVTQQGGIVGFLNATLKSKDQDTGKAVRMAPETDAPAPQVLMRGSVAAANTLVRKFGPGGMTVAYTTAPTAFQRAFDSLIRGKDVDRPSIGVDVKNAEGGGALIEKITPGSEAERAGLKPGDVVIEIDGMPIRKQVDLAKAVMDQEIGSSIRVKVKRGQWTLTVPVRVGSKTGKSPLRPESAI